MVSVKLLFQFEQIGEEFEDIEGVTRFRISQKNRQHNGQKIVYVKLMLNI